MNPRQKNEQTNCLALLLADTDGATAAASGLGVLTTDTEAPVVTQTAVGADLLQALEILTDLGVETVGDNLGVLAIGDVALSVKEPRGDLVLGRGLEDGDDALQLFGGELTSTVIKTPSQLCCSVDLCDFSSAPMSCSYIDSTPIFPVQFSSPSLF
jgi:hypothetical protein